MRSSIPRPTRSSAVSRNCSRSHSVVWRERIRDVFLLDAGSARRPISATVSMMLADQGFLDVGDMRLEYRMIGPRPDAAPTIVLLHEGLGCVAGWGSFAQELAAATGAGVFAYSRAGYGRPSPAKLPRPGPFMHDEGGDLLPRVLAAI